MASEDFLAMFLTSTPKKAVLSQTNSIQCLICAEFLETSNWIAVFGHSQWDLRGTLCKVLGGELQTSIEDLQYVCKRKCYPKLKKIEKMMSNLKSLEEELRAEMSKNAMVRIKRGLSRDQTQEGSLEATPVKKALFPTNPPQNQTRIPSPVTTAREVTSLTGLPSTVSIVVQPSSKGHGLFTLRSSPVKSIKWYCHISLHATFCLRLWRTLLADWTSSILSLFVLQMLQSYPFGN